jgi:opacity protein-like surface antigen
MEPRRRLATLLALACAAAPAAALGQYYPGSPPPASSAPPRGRTELTGFAGYQVNSDVDTTQGNLSVSDTPVYGAAVGVETLPGAWAEFLWLYSDPTVTASGSPLLAGSSPLHVPTHYFQVGGTKGIQRDRVILYGGGTIGTALFMPGTLRYANGTTTSLSDTWRFAFTLGAGLKVDLSRHLAIRLDARVAAPVYFSSGAFYVGSGGSGISVSGGIPIWQWNFLGGLVVLP